MIRNVLLWSGFLVVFLNSLGCLRTREDLQGGEEARKSQPVYNAPQPKDFKGVADSGPVAQQKDPQEAQEEIRGLMGRIEVLENEIQTVKAQHAQEQAASMTREQDLNNKLALLTDSVSKLEERAQATPAVAAAHSEAATPEKPTNPWLTAEEDFKAKNWRSAIANYQKYRTNQPNGKNYAAATYKMALAFQELGLKQDAKAFFDEVISRFPNTEHAKKAQFRVKQLK